ncbi:unnamed protein product [Closterium sp. NIES-53]
MINGAWHSPRSTSNNPPHALPSPLSSPSPSPPSSLLLLPPTPVEVGAVPHGTVSGATSTSRTESGVLLAEAWARMSTPTTPATPITSTPPTSLPASPHPPAKPARTPPQRLPLCNLLQSGFRGGDGWGERLPPCGVGAAEGGAAQGCAEEVRLAGGVEGMRHGQRLHRPETRQCSVAFGLSEKKPHEAAGGAVDCVVRVAAGAEGV